MSINTKFYGDDVRKTRDPKFQNPRFKQYIRAVELLNEFAFENYGKQVIHLAVRWILDQGVQSTLWGARRPEQLKAVNEVMDWIIEKDALDAIDNIINTIIIDPIGPEYMAPYSS